jgi:serine protease Do
MPIIRKINLWPRPGAAYPRRGRALLLAVSLFAMVAPAALRGAEPDLSRPSLYEKVKRASLEILVDDHLAGTAVFVGNEGLVFTAAHVVGRPESRVEVLSPVAGRQKAEVVAVDLGHDLALLKVAPRDGGFPGLALADEAPRAGADVYLMGTPIFRHAVMLRGMLARDGPTFEFYGDRYVEIVHVAATVQSGTSGGPWFDGRGELVGIQSGIMSAKEIPVGIAFVVPLAALRRLVQTQRTAATASPGLAVEETWQQQQDTLKRFPPRTEGLVVRRIKGDGPAARAGVRQWDVITRADGKTVRLPDELLRLVRAKAPGDSLTLTLLSPDGAGTREATLRLGALEVAWSGAGTPPRTK